MTNWKEKAKEWNEKYDDIVAFSELGIFIGAPLRTYSSGMNEIGSYLEEAEAFYKRVEKRRKKSHDKKN